MPPVVAFVAYVGVTTAALVGVTVVAGSAAAFAIGAAVIVGGTMLAAKLATPSISQGVADNDRSRQVTARGTIESQKIIYGEALVSGPLSFVGVSGAGNKNLHHVVALAGHQVEAITEIWLDDQIITTSQMSGTDWVQSGTFQPTGTPEESIVKIIKNLGTSVQVADEDLVTSFSEYTAAHRGRGIANIATTFVLNGESQAIWDKYSPSDIKALVKGRNEIYDPRLDVTVGASPTSATYQAYTDNPALCVADYLVNTKFGMGIAAAKIDWDAVVTAADACDVLVAIPTSATQKRFTANGVLFATDKHQTSLNKLLSSMNGSLVFTSGVYVIRAGIYEAPTETITDDDLVGAISIKTGVERSDRFNTCGGVFIDPAHQHKSMEFPKVQLTAALNRDNSEVLEREIDLPFTNSSYMAQRLAHKLVQLSDQQKIVSFPCNLGGLRIAVGDRVNVTIEEFSWTNKIFRCMAWAFSDSGGVDLTLAEDDSGSYADPAEGAYSTVTEDGTIVDGFPGVPDPAGLAATAGIKSIDLNWTNPSNTSKFDGVILYASTTSAWSGAVEIGRGLLTSFKHDFSTTADPIVENYTRWYWVRAIGTGATGQVLSDRNPDNDTSTVTATAAQNEAQLVEWTVVADASGLRPVNNATVGAQATVNLKNAAGTVLNDADVLNEVLRTEILTVELETGDVLDLETGAEVDIQNLGDVAIWAYDSSVTLQGSIANLSTLLTDVTAGLGDVYVQASAPVAGVSGVPNPIVTSSRWYDSDDDNSPYYWSGSAWVSLLDPRIGSNAASITQLNTDLTTVDGEQTATASALAILDATVVTLDGTVTTVASDVVDLETTVDDATTGVAATSAAQAALTTRVTTAEGTLSTTSTDVVSLVADIQSLDKLEDEGTGVLDTLDLEDGTAIDLQTNDTVGIATSTATRALDARVVITEDGVTAASSDITTLQSDLTSADGLIAANASAATALTTRVTIAEGSISTSATDITNLESTVNNPTTGVSATSVAQGLLTTRVEDTEGDIYTNAQSIDTLESTVNNPTTGVSATSVAQGLLTTRVEDTEGDIYTNAQSIDTLESTVNNPTTGVSATSVAQGLLTTRVEDTEGDIYTNAQSIDTLESTVDHPTTGVSVTASTVDTLNTWSGVADGVINSNASHVLTLNTTVGGHSTTIGQHASSINGIEGRWGVTIDANKNISGFELLSGADTSSFKILANQFLIVDPDSPADAQESVFSVDEEGNTTLQNLTVEGDLLVTGTVNTTQLASEAVNSVLVTETGSHSVTIDDHVDWEPIDDITVDTTDAAGDEPGYVRITVECQFISNDSSNESNSVETRLLRNVPPATSIQINVGSKQRAYVTSGTALASSATLGTNSDNWGHMNVWPRVTLVYYDDDPATGENTYYFQGRLDVATTSGGAVIKTANYFQISAEVVYR